MSTRATRADPEREALLRALLLGERLSLSVTHLMSRTLGQHSTGNRDIQTLLTIWGTPGSTPGQIATATGMSASAVSRSLSRLAADGLAVRRPSLTDGRSSDVWPTRKGLARVRTLDDGIASWVDEEAPTVKEVALLLGLPTPQKGRPPGGLELLGQLTRAGEAYMRDVLPVLEGYGIRDRSERYALTLLLDRERVRPGDLAFELDLSTSGGSDLVTRLEGLDIVRREHDGPADRRAVHVSLTPHGRHAAEAKLDVFAGHARAFMTPFVSTLSPREKEQ